MTRPVYNFAQFEPRDVAPGRYFIERREFLPRSFIPREKGKYRDQAPIVGPAVKTGNSHLRSRKKQETGYHRLMNYSFFIIAVTPIALLSANNLIVA